MNVWQKLRNHRRLKLAKKVSHDQFILDAIARLRKPPHEGIHVVFSNFNAAFLKYYGSEARPFVDDAAKRKLISLRPARGGAIIGPYKEEAAPAEPDEVLDKILGKK